MRDLAGAMAEEKAYIADRMKGIDTSLQTRLIPYGYDKLDKYFVEKKEYLFNQWKPEVYYVDVRTLTTELENAVRNEKYGIYISVADGLYAFHGSDEIDYELCDKLGVCVAELYHKGGTIIGSSADLGIEIVAPMEIGLESSAIINKFHKIISRYVGNAVVSGNDILVNGEKILGSMQRYVGNAFVWAAQISFGDHREVISKVCNKQSIKKPGFINNRLLTRNALESEVVAWLQKR